MTPKERRATLFHNGKPSIRPMEQKDFGWLWANHKLSDEEQLPQDEFMEAVMQAVEGVTDAWIIEDRSKEFKDGFGPVGLMLGMNDGWALVPHIEWFQWAGPRTRLRGAVMVGMRAKYSKEVGCLRIHCGENWAKFYDKLKRYLPVYRAGKVPGGRADGSDYIYYVRGKKRVNGNGRIG